MQITEADWDKYRKKQDSLTTEASDKMLQWLESKGGYFNVDEDELVSYAYALATKYGEGSASLAAQMYDEVAQVSNKILPSAEVAETANYNEIKRAYDAVTENVTTDEHIASIVGRAVKQAGADTTLKNAMRDGAQFAWIPSGDGCPYCISIAAQGWKYATKGTLQGNHAQHIHPNCMCEFAIRFDEKSNVKGYDPQKYRDMYYGAEGKTARDKINSMRRIQYQENKEKINAQKRANYAEKKNKTDYFVGPNQKVLPAIYKDWIGKNQMSNYLKSVKSEEAKRYIITDYRKSSFIGDGGTAAIRKFEIATGLNCGRNGGNHEKKVYDLIHQINKILLKNIPESDKIFLRKRLKELMDTI